MQSSSLTFEAILVILTPGKFRLPGNTGLLPAAADPLLGAFLMAILEAFLVAIVATGFCMATPPGDFLTGIALTKDNFAALADFLAGGAVSPLFEVAARLIGIMLTPF